MGQGTEDLEDQLFRQSDRTTWFSEIKASRKADRKAMRRHHVTERVVWVTAAGAKLKMHEIGDQHLIHIIRLCKRRRAEFLDQATQGSTLGIEDLIRQGAEVHTAKVNTEMTDIIDMFVNEAQRRKLPVT